MSRTRNISALLRGNRQGCNKREERISVNEQLSSPRARRLIDDGSRIKASEEGEEGEEAELGEL